MHTSKEKRYEYWNHFVEKWAVDKVGGGHGVTGARLRKIRMDIFNDDDFWQDVVLRHGGQSQTPEEMVRDDPAGYSHCLGNFWGMIYQNLIEVGLVGITRYSQRENER